MIIQTKISDVHHPSWKDTFSKREYEYLTHVINGLIAHGELKELCIQYGEKNGRRTLHIFEPFCTLNHLGYISPSVVSIAFNDAKKIEFMTGSDNGLEIFSKQVNIRELPHLPGGLASSPFDNDGVATYDRDLVVDGVLNGYFLGVYSARKLGLKTTGNAGGCHNLVVQPGTDDFAALIRGMRRGFLVTELLGQGVNYVTGDYSRGAAGYWIENGEIAYPVDEVTIAGNLRDMFLDIEAVGNDVLVRGSKQVGSLLVGRMKVAGA